MSYVPGMTAGCAETQKDCEQKESVCFCLQWCWREGNGFTSKESSSVLSILVPSSAEVLERHPTEVAR